MHSPKEEQAAVREDDPVTAGVSRRSLHQLPVLVPVNDRLRVSTSLEMMRKMSLYIIKDELIKIIIRIPIDYILNILLELGNVKLKKFVIRKVTTNGYTLVKLGF